MTQQQSAPINDGAHTAPEDAVQGGETHGTAETSPASDSELQLAAARQEAQANLEGWQRTLAEFQNYKRRTEREVKDTYQSATSALITDLLPIIDDFERAMESLPPDLKGQPWLEGVTLIQRKFNRLLEDYHVSAVDPVGQPFDPNLHQAIGTDEDSTMESGHVTVTLQKGYTVGDRVLRPALVKVAP